MKVQSVLLLFVIQIMNIKAVQCIYEGYEATGESDFEHHVLVWDYCSCVCGGSVIDELHILTAAHCVYDRIQHNVYVSGGMINLKARITRKVRKIHVSKDFAPDCDDPSEFGDIAILTLETPFILGSRVRPVSLPNRGLPSRYATYDFFGWGRTDPDVPGPSMLLMWTELFILSPEDCKNRSAPHTDKGLCAINPWRQSTTLQGDSGGGLVTEGIIVGVLSNNAEEPDVPMKFVKVSSYLSFILEVIDEDREFYPSSSAEDPPADLPFPFLCPPYPDCSSYSNSDSDDN